MANYPRNSRLLAAAVLALAAIAPGPCVPPPDPDPDTNDDGVVNILDVSLVASCQGQDVNTNATCAPADVDGDGDVDPDDLTIVVEHFGEGTPTGPANRAPVASAGRDRTLAVGEPVQLDGSGSTDLDGDPLVFAWTLSTPAGSLASLSDPSAVRPGFTLDLPGTYVAELRVDDGSDASLPDEVAITTGNSPPVADAGPDQTVAPGDRVRLDAAGSTDVDGDLLTFSWNLTDAPAGSAAGLDDPTALRPGFDADLPGRYVVELVVDDGGTQSDADAVVVATDGSAPVSHAGPDRSAVVGTPVSLDGRGSSDADGDDLSFSWSLIVAPTGSTASLSGPDAAEPELEPDQQGVYVAQLVVSDGSSDAAPDTVVVSTDNSTPRADAGPDQSVPLEALVTLDGVGSSDDDDDPLAFHWALTSLPPGSAAALSDPHAAETRFTADQPGDYLAQLIVDDGVTQGAPDTVVISTANQAPTANAGDDLVAFLGDTVQLDGSGSFDPEDDPLMFSWQLTGAPAGSAAALDDPSAVAPSLVVDVRGVYLAELVVDDGRGASDPDEVRIEVRNRAPTGDAGEDQQVRLDDTVLLDGSGSSDDDGDPLGFTWSLATVPPGSGATLAGAGSATPSFVPDVAGGYVVELVVDDGMDASTPTRVRIIASGGAPDLAPIPDQQVTVGSTLLIQLSASDPENDQITFGATVPLPAGASLDVDGLFTFRPGLAQVGEHEIAFRASDGTLVDSETARITVTGGVPGAPTRLLGRLLDTNDFTLGTETPVVGAIVSLLGTGIETTSDADGNFVLDGIPDGSRVLDIATASASPAPDGSGYAAFREEIRILAGIDNVVERPFFLPRIDAGSLTPIDPGQMTIVTNDALGVSVMVAAGSARKADGSAFSGELSISEVPENLAPAALPPELGFAQLVTIQPVGVSFDTPAPITFPNLDGLPPGSEVDIWSLDPETGTFVIVGTGRVTADGSKILTTSGGIRQADWHGVLSPVLGLGGGLDDNRDQCLCNAPEIGSRTAVASGELSVDHTLVHYRSLGRNRRLRFVYNSSTANPRPTIRFEPTISVRAAVPNLVSARLGVGGVGRRVGPITGVLGSPFSRNCGLRTGLPFSGGGGVFTDTSGLSESKDETISMVVQLDGTGFPTGIHAYELHVSSLYPRSCATSILNGEVLVHNQRESPFGAGWTLDGLQQLHFGTEGSGIVVTEGNGTIKRFEEIESDPDAFTSPPGDFSTLNRNPDGSFTRSYPSGRRVNFSPGGLHVSDVDRNGNTNTYAYDGFGRLESITDAVDRVTTLAHSAPSRLNSVTDPAGRVTRFEHDLLGNLVRIIDPDGSARSFEYDLDHKLISQTSKRGFLTTYGYDTSGRNVQVTRPDASVVRISPSDTAGLADPAGGPGGELDPMEARRPGETVASITNGNGDTTLYKSNAFGSTSERIDPLGASTRLEHDDDGRVVRSTDARGAVSEFGYDDLGNLRTMTDAVGDPLQRTASFTYLPGTDRVDVITNQRGGTLDHDYDADGNLVRLVDQVDEERTGDHDDRGLLLSRTDPNNRTRTFDYDEFGNLSRITDPLGNETTFDRDAAGSITRVTEAVGTPEERVVGFAYDAMNRAISIVGPELSTARYDYDADGNVVRITNATSQSAEIEYDELGRPVSFTNGLTAGTRSLARDPAGNVISVTGPLGRTTRYEFDASRRVTSATHATGDRETFAYDENGQLVRLDDALGQPTHFEYDTLNRVVREVDALGHATTFTWDAMDNVVTRTDAEGRTRTNTFDLADRPTRVDTPDEVRVYTWDGAGNLLSAENDHSRLLYSYDELNRIRTVSTEDLGHQPASTLTYSYDSVHNRVRVDDSEGGTTGYAYSQSSQLRQVTTPANDAISQDFDPWGRPSRITYPNGVVSDFFYDLRSRLMRLEHTIPGDTTRFDYSYSLLGQVLSIDELGTIRSGAAPEIETLVYDDANRLLEDARFTYTHDANGNLRTRTSKVDGTTTTYSFDVAGRLVRLDLPDGSVAAYRYDVFGRRIEKDVDGVVTRYVYDRDDIVLEYDGSGAIRARYTHGLRVDQPLSMQRDGASYFYHPDHLGSIRKLTDASGTLANVYDYRAFGTLENVAESVANPYAFTGRERDAESGLYYYRWRYYDPDSRRFISADPAGFGGGDFNLYRYVRGDPVRFTDPDGRVVKWLVSGVRLVGRLQEPARIAWRAFDDKVLKTISRKADDAVDVQRRNEAGLDALSDNLGDTPDELMDLADLAARRADEARDGLDAQRRAGRSLFPDSAGGTGPVVVAGGAVLVGSGTAEASPLDDGTPCPVSPEDIEDDGESFFGALAGAVFPGAAETYDDPGSSGLDVFTSGLWDVVKYIDPIFLTDGIEYAAGL